MIKKLDAVACCVRVWTHLALRMQHGAEARAGTWKNSATRCKSEAVEHKRY